MTQLRNQLRDARRAYHAAAYPGDLAAELMPARKGRRRWFFPVAAGGAAAAAAAVVLVAFRAAVPEPTKVVAGNDLPPLLVDRPRPTPLVYRLPDRMPLSLPAAPLMPATPPVSVSLTGLSGLRPPPYEELGPRLWQHLNWSHLVQPQAVPMVPPPEGAGATTQQAV